MSGLTFRVVRSRGHEHALPNPLHFPGREAYVSTVIPLRPASPSDVAELREIVNAAVAQGGLTAINHALDDDETADYFVSGRYVVACFVATADPGPGILAFQSIERALEDPGILEISTFVRQTHRQRGLGGLLFEHTRRAAMAAGFRAIDVTVRADNAGGLCFYRKLGFRPYRTTTVRHGSSGPDLTKVHHRLPLGAGPG